MDFDAEAKRIVAGLTLEEKASLLSGKDTWSTRNIGEVPSIFMTDGPHGLRKALTGLNGLPATCFPTASALASTWNPDLVQQVGSAIGVEAQAADVQVVLGPGTNMKRSPLGGRNFEYFSEDPVLAGEMAAAHINGLQSQGVGASLKHFAANNQEFERFQNDSVVDERTLNEIYLKAFEVAVRRAKPWSVMASYNMLNGVHSSESEWLLQSTLRDRWGYKGIVVSDWGAAAVGRVAGVKAGLHLEMPGGSSENTKLIVQAVLAGKLKEQLLNTRLKQLVTAILKVDSTRRPETKFSIDDHHELARQAASEAVVLLKNESHLLPIKSGRAKKIAIIGQLAKIPRFEGGGSSQITPTKVDNLYDQLKAIFEVKVELTYAKGYHEKDGSTTPKLVNDAVLAARDVDIVIVTVGLPASFEIEGIDRPQLGLPDGHNELIEAVAKVNPKTVVVLTNGSAVTMPWLSKVPAVVEGWLSGQAGAAAIADILAGRVNPSGKLSETFPCRIEDTPAYPDFPNRTGNARYGEGIFIGYRWYDKRAIEPLFEFGYGLSYTTFKFSNLKLSHETIFDDDSLTIEVDVKNTGEVAGKEVVQLYVGIQDHNEVHPPAELKKFQKIYLRPSEEQTVTLSLKPSDLAYFSDFTRDWRVPTGEITIYVGSSSRNLPLHRVVAVKARREAIPELLPSSPLKDFARHPRGKHFFDLLGGQLAKSFGGVDEKQTKKEADAMTMSLIGDLPLNRLPGLSGGIMSSDFVDAVMGYVKYESGFHPVASFRYYKELVRLLLRALRSLR